MAKTKGEPSRKRPKPQQGGGSKGWRSWLPWTVALAAVIVVSAALLKGTIGKVRPTALQVVGFLPDYRYGAADVAFMASQVTELVLFSLEVEGSSGRLVGRDRLPDEAGMQRLREVTRESGARLGVAVGGAGRSAGFPAMVKSAEKRRAFVEDVAALIDAYGLQVLELNWQFPSGPQEIKLLGQLAAELKQRAAHVSLSMACPPQAAFFTRIAELSGVFDVFHVMLYLDPMADAPALLRQITRWHPPERLTAGLPFFLHSEQGAQSYEEALKPGAAIEAEAFWEVAKRTVAAARDAKLAGISIWELGQDCRPHAVGTHPATCSSISQSLLHRIANSLL